MSIKIRRFFCIFCALAGAVFLPAAAFSASSYAGAAGSGTSTILDVWLQHGGARLQYNALVAPRQMNTGGAALSDPARLPVLQPLQSWPVKPQRKRFVRRAVPKQQTAATTSLRNAAAPTGAALTPVPMPAATPAPAVGPAPAPTAAPRPMAVPGTPAVPKH